MDRQKLSVAAVIEKCGLRDTPHLTAYRAIANWASSFDGFGLYFDRDVEATALSEEPELRFDRGGRVGNELSPGYLICGGSAENVAGQKRATHFSIVKVHNVYWLYVDRFSVNDVSYACCDVTCMWIDSVRIELDEAYCLRNEVDQFLAQDSPAVSIKPPAGEPGLQKAIALLAVEKAYELPKFRTGNKVNASAFKEHVLTLAEKYGETPDLMKSLDDKINKKLKELGLNELDLKKLDSRDP